MRPASQPFLSTTPRLHSLSPLSLPPPIWVSLPSPSFTCRFLFLYDSTALIAFPYQDKARERESEGEREKEKERERERAPPPQQVKVPPCPAACLPACLLACVKRKEKRKRYLGIKERHRSIYHHTSAGRPSASDHHIDRETALPGSKPLRRSSIHLIPTSSNLEEKGITTHTTPHLM